MIINIIGAPASGKSTFASRFIVEHPEYRYCSIDAYRLEYADEEKAWDNLGYNALNNKIVLLESSGLSWRLNEIFMEAKFNKTPILTIAFIGQADILHQRLNERQKRKIPYPYNFDEHQTIDFVVKKLSEGVINIDYSVNVSQKDKNQVYTEVSNEIAKFRGRNVIGEKMISGVLVWLPKGNTNSKIKANGVFTVNDAFQIKYTLFNGPKGMYVSLPGRYGDKIDEATGKKTWYSDVKVVSDEAKKQMEKAVLDAYNKKVGNATTKAIEARFQQEDEVPF